MKRFLLTFACVAVLSISNTVAAAVVFDVSLSPAVLAGDPTIVTISATSATNDSITGFQLALDVGGDGYTGVANGPSVLPNGLSFGAPLIQNQFTDGSGTRVIGAQTTGGQLGLANADAIITMAGAAPVGLSSGVTTLFELVLDTSLVSSGTTPILIRDGFFTSATLEGGGVTPVSSNSGSVTVTAVPEPGSLAICGLLCAGVAARRRCKFKKCKLQTS